MAEDHPGVDDELREQLECNVCTDVLLNPVTTPCGHTFCKECLSRAVDVRNQCPLCRTILLVGACAEIPVNVTLASVISKLLPASLAARRERAAQEAAGTRATDGAGREGLLPIFVMSEMFPYQKMQLNIFEPRYRQMYSDILFNGSRRFAVPVSNPETGRLATVAPVFYLEDLKEVSEQTDDAVKYVCSHKVIGRVRINRTLNDKVWRDRTTYLKAVVEPLEDGDDDEDLSTRERTLTDRFTSIIENQTKLQEPVRFTENLKATLSAARGEDGLWRMAGLWQSLMQNRLAAKESELSDEIQKLLRQYLESQGQDMRSKVTVQFDSLPAEIRAEFTRLQQQYREESAAMVSATIYPFVLLVQCDTHAERLSVFGEMLEEEEKRLQAKVALQSLFSGGMGGADAKGLDEPPTEA